MIDLDALAAQYLAEAWDAYVAVDPWQFVHVADQTAGRVARDFPWMADDLRGEARAQLPAAVASCPAGGDMDGWLRVVLRRRLYDVVRRQTTTYMDPHRVGMGSNGRGRAKARRSKWEVSLTPPEGWSGSPEDYLRLGVPSHEDEVVDRVWWAYVRARVARLPERQRRAVCERGDDWALAAEWGVSRPRVSQIRRQAFEALADIEGEVA